MAAKPAGTPKAKKASKPKVASSHPPYASMIKSAISNLKEKKGSSKHAILKYILANYKVGSSPTAVNSRLRIALRRAEKTGLIQHAKGGVGALGSFKLTDKKKSTAQKKPKVKKPKAKKVKKSSTGPKKAAASEPKKAKSPAKKAAKKAPAAKKAKASPKKAAGRPKKTASPKKKAAAKK